MVELSLWHTSHHRLWETIVCFSFQNPAFALLLWSTVRGMIKENKLNLSSGEAETSQNMDILNQKVEQFKSFGGSCGDADVSLLNWLDGEI